MPLSTLEPIGDMMRILMEESEAKSGVTLSRLEQIPGIEQIRSTESFCPQLRFFLFITRLLSSSQVVVKFTTKQKNERGWTIQQEKTDFRCFVHFVFLYSRHTNFNLVSRFYNWGIGWPPSCLLLVDRLLLCPPPLFPLVGGFIVISVFLALGLISKDRRELLTKQEYILCTFYW